MAKPHKLLTIWPGDHGRCADINAKCPDGMPPTPTGKYGNGWNGYTGSIYNDGTGRKKGHRNLPPNPPGF